MTAPSPEVGPTDKPTTDDPTLLAERVIEEALSNRRGWINVSSTAIATTVVSALKQAGWTLVEPKPDQSLCRVCGAKLVMTIASRWPVGPPRPVMACPNHAAHLVSAPVGGGQRDNE